MIDTHCHLLPGLDDGPASEVEAAQLARQLVRDGVSYVLCTPHFSRVYPTSTERARAALLRMRDHLAALELRLEIGLAAEVSSELLASPAEELLERAIDGRYLIVELDRGAPAALLTEASSRLGELSLTPVFAHPERCRAVRQDGALVDEVRAQGALCQVVVPSLAGRWGDDVARAGWAMLDDARADLVASDAHRPSLTRATLRTTLSRIGEAYGRETLAELTERAPARLLGPIVATADSSSERNATGG